MKKTGLVLIATLLLGACASNGMHEGMVYRDGSWYAPASEGRGDYYTATEHRHDEAYDWPWAWSVGFVPYGGYCPVQYRYCTSFWADSWYGGPSHYYPYAYAYSSQPWVGHRRRQRQQEVESPLAELPANRQRIREPGEPRPMRTRNGGAGGGMRGEDGGAPRPRRRAGSAGTNPN